MYVNLLGSYALILWMPIVLAIFLVRPAREATTFAFLFAWLALPNIKYDLPGIPDWSKVTATVVGVMIGIFLFDPARLFALRFRAYDWPIAIWCSLPMASAVVNGQGPYEGGSASLDHVFSWGLPYIIGRVYYSDAAGVRQLALGIVVGGLVYMGPCLVEMRLGPTFARILYGINRWEGIRYGGYRPTVLLSTGLELGMWMTCATLTAAMLWAGGSVKRLRNVSFGTLALGLAAVTVLCKSTGALALLVAGLGMLAAVRLTKRSWPAWALIAIAPFFTLARATGNWDGAQLVEATRLLLNEDRAGSIDFRFKCEEYHIRRAMQKPALGWGRDGGFLNMAGTAYERTIDGYWIIALGGFGIAGLVTLNTMLLLPQALMIRRFPASTWFQPDVAPVAAIATVLTLFMLDNLSNAMLNPIYALAMGGISGLTRSRLGSSREESEAALAEALRLEAEGRAEALPAFEAAVGLASARATSDPGTLEVRAEALEGLARSTGPGPESEMTLREALDLRLALIGDGGDPTRVRDLAIAHGQLARSLAGSGRLAEAIAERRKALDLWSAMARRRPDDLEILAGRVSALNDLAWSLAAEAGPLAGDPAEAVALASEAARLDPGDPGCWNTLGVARYRADDLRGAVEALEYAVDADPHGGTAFDHFFLSMAYRKLGEVEIARDRFDRAVDWADRHRPGHPGLAQFRSEAAAVLAGSSLRKLMRG